jgi:hypothetical protein
MDRRPTIKVGLTLEELRAFHFLPRLRPRAAASEIDAPFAVKERGPDACRSRLRGHAFDIFLRDHRIVLLAERLL